MEESARKASVNPGEATEHGKTRLLDLNRHWESIEEYR
jgi:hypothetical protein